MARLLAAIIAISMPLAAQGAATAFLPFESDDSSPEAVRLAEELGEGVAAVLLSAGERIFVEREHLKAAIAELTLGSSGLSAGDRVRVGQMTGADLLISGRVEKDPVAGYLLEIGIIGARRANLFAREKVEVPTLRELHRMPHAKSVKPIAARIEILLQQAEERLGAMEKKQIVAPLFFGNRGSAAMASFEAELQRAFDRAEKTAPVFCLRFESIDPARGEAELAITGLLGEAGEATRLADLFVWGDFQDLHQPGARLEDLPAFVTLYVWDGRSEPIELKIEGRTSNLPELADRAVAAALATREGPPSPPASRLRVAQMVWLHASDLHARLFREWRKPEFAGSEREFAWRRHLVALLSLASFLDPAPQEWHELRFQQALMSLPRMKVNEELQLKIAAEYMEFALARWKAGDSLDVALLNRAMSAVGKPLGVRANGGHVSGVFEFEGEESVWGSRVHDYLAAAAAGILELSADQRLQLREVLSFWIGMASVGTVSERVENFYAIWPVFAPIYLKMRSEDPSAARSGFFELGWESRFRDAGRAAAFGVALRSPPPLPPDGFRQLKNSPPPEFHQTPSVPIQIIHEPRSEERRTFVNHSDGERDGFLSADGQPEPDPWETIPELDLGVIGFNPIGNSQADAGPPFESGTVVKLAVADHELWIAGEFARPPGPEENSPDRKDIHWRLWQVNLPRREAVDWYPQLELNSGINGLAITDDFIWISSNTAGLRRIDRETGRIDRIDSSHGLPSNHVERLEAVGEVIVVETRVEDRRYFARWIKGDDAWVAIDPDPTGIPAFGRAIAGAAEAVEPSEEMLRTVLAFPKMGDRPRSMRSTRGQDAPKATASTAAEDGALVAYSGVLYLLTSDRNKLVFLPRGSPTTVADDGRLIFITYEAPLENSHSFTSHLIVYDREEAAWVGKMRLPGIVNASAAVPGILWLGRQSLLGWSVIEFNTAVLTGPRSLPKSPSSNNDVWTAAWQGDRDGLARALESGADPNERSATGWSPLLAALSGRNPDIAEVLFEAGVDLETADVSGWHPLLIAWARNDTDILQRLLEMGLSPDFQAPFVPVSQPVRRKERSKLTMPLYTNHGRTVLHAAVEKDDVKTITQFIQAGADPNLPDAAGNTPLHRAALFNKVAAMKALLAGDADSEIANIEGITPIQYARQRGADVETIFSEANHAIDPLEGGRRLATEMRQLSLREVTDLLARGANPSWTAPNGSNALATAIEMGRWEEVKLLMDHGFDPSIEWPTLFGHMVTAGPRALSAAVKAGRIELLKTLLSLGANANPDPDHYRHNSPLFIAVRERNVDATRVLLKAGARPLSYEPHHVLIEAVAQEHIEMLELLIPYFPNDIDSFDDRAGTPLGRAAGAGWVEGVRILLQAGADPDQRDQSGVSPAEHAGSNPVIHALLESGGLSTHPSDVGLLFVAIVSGDDNAALKIIEAAEAAGKVAADGRTALMLALLRQRFALVEPLLNAGADPTATDRDGKGVLDYAIESGNVAALRALLDQGADPNQLAPDRGSPLAAAIDLGHIQMAQILLRADADPDLAHPGMPTPLFFAFLKGPVSLIETLLSEGADFTYQTAHKDSILHWAASSGNPESLKAALKLNPSGNPNRHGLTPLTIAIAKGNTEMVRLLLAAGYRDPTATDRAIKNLPETVPLLLEAMREDGDPVATEYDFWGMDPTAPLPGVEAIRAHLDTGGDVNFPSPATPLQRAASQGREEVVRLLLEHGADPLLLGRLERDSPLAKAIQAAGESGSTQIVEFLLTHGADPEDRARLREWPVGLYPDGPLLNAIKFGHVEMVRVLAAAGATPTEENHEGNDAFEVLVKSSISAEKKIAIRAILERLPKDQP